MTKLKLTAAFALSSVAALSGCTVCVDCEPQSARTATAPLGRQGTTYYYSDSWNEPRPAVSASYSSSAPLVMTAPAASYRPAPTQLAWRSTISSGYYPYSSSYYPQPARYAYQQYQQRPAVNRQYAYWPYTSPPELPSAEWQARFIGRPPQTIYYYPPANSLTNSSWDGSSRRYWTSPSSTMSGSQVPVHFGPAWYYP